MIFRPVIKFKFKNQKYLLLLNEQNKRYFLRINENNEFEYITIEECLDLAHLFTHTPLVMHSKNESLKKYKFDPKIVVKGLLVTTSLSLLLSACKSNPAKQNNYYDVPSTSVTDTEDDDLIRDLAFVPMDSDEELVVDDYMESEWLNYITVYDMDYLNKIFPDEEITKEKIYNVIDNNANISPKFKNLVKVYVDLVSNKYPNANLRVLYENLKTMEFVECTESELHGKTLDFDSCAAYFRDENKIYVLKDYEYTEGTWDYQVFMHEIGHALRNKWFKQGEKDCRIQFEGQYVSQTSVAEAIHSVFTVSILPYEEKDIAYQLQSNYFTVIFDSLDNYTLEDYVNHSMTYLAKKMDETTGHNNYASVIFELIEAQYKDYHSSWIEIEQEEYYPLYDYIAKMYFDKYIHDDTTYEDASQICKELVERITYDVPEEYNIDINHFYDYFEEYVSSRGIESNLHR